MHSLVLLSKATFKLCIHVHTFLDVFQVSFRVFSEITSAKQSLMLRKGGEGYPQVSKMNPELRLFAACFVLSTSTVYSILEMKPAFDHNQA